MLWSNIAFIKEIIRVMNDTTHIGLALSYCHFAEYH